MKKLILLSVLLSSSLVFAATKAIPFKLTNDLNDKMKVQKAQAIIDKSGLTAQAKQDGITDYTFEGTAQTSTYGAGTTKYDITWNKAKRDGKAVSVNDQNLTSAFVNKGAVKKGEVVNAVGNVDGLTSIFTDFDKKSKPDTQDGKEKDPDAVTAAKKNTVARSPSGSSGSGSFNNADNSGIGENSNTGVLTTNYEECDADYDLLAKKAFTRHKEVTYQGGEVIKTGSCVRYGEGQDLTSELELCGYDFDTTASTANPKYIESLSYDNKVVKRSTCSVDTSKIIPIQINREYDKVCHNLVDYDAMTVKPNFREVALVDGEEVEVSGCQYDTLQPLLTSYDECNKRHDFIAGITYEQQIYYYMKDGQKEPVTQCVDDTNKAYAHYLTTNTCDFTELDPTHIILNKRTAYELDNGTVEYATSCQPVSSSIELTTEFCGYDDDLIANVSYEKTKSYYTDPDTNVITEVSACGRTTTSYPHQLEVCGWEYDDANLRAFQKFTRYFEDPVRGRVDFNGGECLPSETPIPYVDGGEQVTALQNFGIQEVQQSGDIWYFGSNFTNEISYYTSRAAESVVAKTDSYCPMGTNGIACADAPFALTDAYQVACDAGYDRIITHYDTFGGYDQATCVKNWNEAQIYEYSIKHTQTRPDGTTLLNVDRTEYGF